MRHGIDVDAKPMVRPSFFDPRYNPNQIGRGAGHDPASDAARLPKELPAGKRHTQEPVKRTPSNIALRKKHLEKLLDLRRSGNLTGAQQARGTFQKTRRKKWLPTDAGQLGGKGTDYQRMRAHTEYQGSGSPLSEMLRRRLRNG